MKEDLCRAFCAELAVAKVPAGFAVGTAFEKEDGDRITFYILGPSATGDYRLQDDGSTVPMIEASGADLGVAARAEVFHSLLSEYGAVYDQDTFELSTEPLPEAEVPRAALQFVALLLRLQDLLLLSRERAESTWIQEAIRDIEHAVGGRAEIVEDGVVSPELSAYPADIVIRAPAHPPVAVFFGSSDTKAYEALLLHSYAKYQVRLDCSVVVLLEKDSSLSKKVRQRVDNNLIVPRYRGGEIEAIGRIVEVAVGMRPLLQ
jgi:hypothetical protein